MSLHEWLTNVGLFAFRLCDTVRLGCVFCYAMTHRGIQVHTRRRLMMAGLLAAVFTGAVLQSGCRRVLFREKDSRTQFDSYDRLRDGVAPPYVFDEFGYRQPNLRERLAPGSD